jgi:predicted nucleotidyltransferase component of viral defense system
MKFMLNLETLKKFTNQYQTVEKNVVREYVQHLFLSCLYKLPGANCLLFKGGTALRIIFESPRFSEDLDFTGVNIYRTNIIDNLFIEALSCVEKQKIKIDLTEAKPTTGGYLGIIHYEIYDFIEDMKFEVSLRQGKSLDKELNTIENIYAPAYAIISPTRKEIIKGKMDALTSRKKPRDYYDLYFFLRHPELRKLVDKNRLQEVLGNLEKEKINFKEDISPFLPASHKMILKDFKKNLIKEIRANLN